MNEDYTLTAFAEPITALADDPQLPPDEMKRRLQAPADEVRQAHNALAQTVKGITDATYPDTVTREMLTQDVRDELDGKADAEDVTAETQSLDARLDTVETALPQKAECYFGIYTGNGSATRDISLGFTPQAVVIMREDGATCMQYDCNGGIAMPDLPCVYDGDTAIEVITDGFRVFFTKLSSSYYVRTNESNRTFYYFAFK